MRKALLLIAILLIVGGVSAFLVFRLTRKPTPTPIGWRAHVTTFAGEAPRVRDSQQLPGSVFGSIRIAVAQDGTIYVSDAGESNRIRKIMPEGVVSTFAGGNEGFADGAGSAASFNTPSGLAIDSTAISTSPIPRTIVFGKSLRPVKCRRSRRWNGRLPRRSSSSGTFQWANRSRGRYWRECFRRRHLQRSHSHDFA